MSSHTAFVGSIPQLYDRHFGPVLFEPYARDLSQRLETRAGLRVLEIACGTGVLTRRMLERLPADGALVATDLNGAMIAHARSVVPADARLSWREADAQQLPFADATFDVVVCQFGLMFLPDRLAGLREARRVLRRGGQLLFSVWDSIEANEYGRIGHETIGSFFPEDPPQFYRMPFGWNDAQDVRRTVAQAGFESIELETVEREAVSESARSFAIGMVQGNPVWNAIVERGGDAAAILDAVERRMAEAWGSAPCRGTIRAHVVTARA